MSSSVFPSASAPPNPSVVPSESIPAAAVAPEFQPPKKKRKYDTEGRAADSAIDLSGISPPSSPPLASLMDMDSHTPATLPAARPQRRAKTEASQRVLAMTVSLQDNTEIGGKRMNSSNSHAFKPANSPHTALKAPSAVHSSHPYSPATPSSIVPSSSSSRKKRVMLTIDGDEVEDDGDSEMMEADEEEPADAEDEEEEKEQTQRARRFNASTKRANTSEGRDGASGSGKSSGLTKTATKAASRTDHQASNFHPSHTAAAAASSSSFAPSSVPFSSSSSSVNATTSSSSMPIPVSRKRERRDKRASGFGSWKVVHKSSIPAMTWEGYEDLATETLELETQESMRQSQPYSPEGQDCYHYDPWPIISAREEMPLTLMRRVDTKFGREEFKVKAMRTIEKKEVVCFLGGRLMEGVKANKQMREDWKQNFYMKKEWLKEFFEYNGKHDLVVTTRDHKTIGSYIRSPEERDDGEEGPNLKADVYFDFKTGLFFIIYYAVERIRRGLEVFCMPFLGDWHDRCHREMFLYSRVSHWYHKYVKRLEENLLRLNIRFDSSIGSMKSTILTADEEEKFLNIPGFDQGTLPEPPPMEKSMKIISIEEAMEYCKCTYSAMAQQELGSEATHYIEAVGDFIPDFLEVKGPLAGEFDEQGNPAIGITKHYVNEEEVRALILRGYRENCLQLREEVGIHSPVRHFTPPNYRSFCVVATTLIPKGTFVFCYAGELTEEIIHRDSAYVYVIEREQVRRTVRSYHGPDLSLDALKVGNISRFVNDNTYRVGESEQKGSTANLETQFLFLNGTIHLGFYTTRDVQINEELVSQYGEDYWKTINKQLISEHKKYFDYINPYCRKLEALTLKSGSTLPQHPPYRWDDETEELFSEKPVSYPQLADPESEDEGAHEVERILQMREDSEGRTEYYVKWKFSSQADNSWIKEKQIIQCQELIQEFLESERNRKNKSASNNVTSLNTSKKKTSKR